MKPQLTKIVYKNKYFSIGLENGYYSLIPKYQDVLILPIVDKNKFLLIKAKRKLLKKSLYEFPAGGFEIKKERPIKAAKREFVEETGIDIFSLQFLYESYDEDCQVITFYTNNFEGSIYTKENHIVKWLPLYDLTKSKKWPEYNSKVYEMYLKLPNKN